jgi:aminopeptidase N
MAQRRRRSFAASFCRRQQFPPSEVLVVNRIPKCAQACAVAAAIWPILVVCVSAQPTHDVKIIFDPETHEIRVEAAIADAEELALTPADWIEVEELRVGDDPRNSTGEPIALTASDIAGQAVEIRLTGQLPEAPEAFGRFGAFPGGAFMFGGDGWLLMPPDGRGIFNVTAQTSAADRAVATGDLLEEHVGEDAYTATFRLEGDGDDLTVLFGPYVVEEAFSGDLRLRTYFPERHAGEADAYLEAMAAYIAHYEELIGAYPFEGFSVVSAPIPVGYGLRGLTYVSERILPQPYMRGRSLAHEILHSWWGHGVRIDYASGNWGEGLTTYQADYALAEAEGEEAAREMRREWLRRLSVLPSALDTPARAFRSAGHGAEQSIGYDKVAMIFHMLPRTLGADVFDAGVRAFWEANRGGTAAWPDLQAAFEAASGRDLGAFFEQWLDRPGLPSIAFGEVRSDEAGERHAVSVTLVQTEPPNALDVPIVIETAGGTAVRNLRLDAAEATASFTVDARPGAVQIDPDYHIARRLPRGELPDSFREALWTATTTMTPSDEAPSAAAAADLTARLAPEARGVDPSVPDDAEGAVLAVGPTSEILALRNAQLAGEAPQVATRGTSRAWVERDGRDRLWMFISADDPDAFGSLYALRYFGALSYAAFDGSEPIVTGSWPVDSNPLRVDLHR